MNSATGTNISFAVSTGSGCSQFCIIVQTKQQDSLGFSDQFAYFYVCESFSCTYVHQLHRVSSEDK